MSDAMTVINLVIAAAGLTICVLGLVQTLLDRNLNARARRFFLLIFSLLVVYVSLDLIGQITDDYTGPFAAAVSRTLLFLESIVSASTTVVLLTFLLDSCGDNWRHNKLFYVAVVLLLVYLAMLVCTEFTGIFYQIDDDNVYRHGPLYPLLLVPPVLILVLNLVVFSRTQAKELLAFLVDRVGGTCTWQEIALALWEDRRVKNPRGYLRVLTNDLRETLASVGMEDVLVREHGQWAVNSDLLDCDYYRMLAGDVDAITAFHDEYMKQYSWAEVTAAKLHFMREARMGGSAI